MEYATLGTSDIKVTRTCLGTMTWGAQNSLEDAKAQLDLAVDYGVNFIDTAELYPVPPTADAAGRTEAYLGEWLKTSNKRQNLIIATKMAGPGRFIRNGAGLQPEDVAVAVDGSLKRLGIEAIDLYQLHWPQRQMNSFAQRDFQPEKHTSFTGENMEAMLEALERQIKAGKIREIGVSNESPWGVMKYLELAAQKGLPRIQTWQDPYSLMQRRFDIHSSEVSLHENVGLLAYSPLAGGILSGKYLDGNFPEGARFTLPFGKNLMNAHYANADSPVLRQYVDLAANSGLTPVQLALGFVYSRRFVTSNIIGATTLTQLEECLSASDLRLSSDVLEAIETIHEAHPNPSLIRSGPRDRG